MYRRCTGNHTWWGTQVRVLMNNFDFKIYSGGHQGTGWMYQEQSIRKVFLEETDVPEVYRDTQWQPMGATALDRRIWVDC